MEKILTVVVPVYNMERYLDQCLQSLIPKKHRDVLEVLVIDDGSGDSSVQIAGKYAEAFPEIFRVISKENGGHGSVLNRGIQEAEGTYLKIVDSDDWVDTDAFDRLLEYLLEDASGDIVYSNYYWVNEKNGKKKAEFPQPFAGVQYRSLYRLKDISEPYFLKMHGYTVRTAIMRRIPRIDENCFYVDMEFVLFPVPFAETVEFLDEYVYMYRIGNAGQSMSPEKLRKNAANYDRVLKRLLEYYRCWKKKGMDQARLSYMEHVLGRMTASRMKIFLTYPCRRKVEERMRKMDCSLYNRYREVYDAVKNPAVRILRKTDYHLYPLARLMFYCRERLR